MSYNKDTDYQAKINEAVASGDYVSAAKYEQSRNEKIDKENLGYEKTNRYSGWLDTTDYSVKLKNQMSAGASKKAVSDTLKKRVEKASGTDGLIKYAADAYTEEVCVHTPLVLEDKEDISEYLKNKDVVLVPKHYEKYFGTEGSAQIKNFAGEVVECFYEMDEGSLLYLENKIKRLLNEKTI